MLQTPTTNLYKEDFELWLKITIQQIKSRQLEHLDWDNLIEELESLGKSDLRELERRLTTLFEHALQ